MASTMQLEFAQAMSDFKVMFPEMDRDVIEAVLRANQGAVDATIDQLLAMSTDNQNERLRNELDKSGGGSNCTPKKFVHMSSSSRNNVQQQQDKRNLLTASPTHSQQQAQQQHSVLSTGASPKIKKIILPTYTKNSSPIRKMDEQQSQQQQKPLRIQRKWDPPLLSPLPSNFLRLSSIEGRNEAEMPDEQFALMLQNEEFMNELRWNQEFMLALDKEQHEKGRHEDEMAFKERLRYMGKKSRKKFHQLARVFTWQRNKKPAAVKYPDSLLLQEEHSDEDEPKKVTTTKNHAAANHINLLVYGSEQMKDV